MWFDNFLRNWEWTDDLADFLWSGKCHHAILLVPTGTEFMDAFLDFAQYLRSEGDGEWTVSVQQSDEVEPHRFCLVQFRGPALFWWSHKVRNDWFSHSSELTA